MDAVGTGFNCPSRRGVRFIKIRDLSYSKMTENGREGNNTSSPSYKGVCLVGVRGERVECIHSEKVLRLICFFTLFAANRFLCLPIYQLC